MQTKLVSAPNGGTTSRGRGNGGMGGRASVPCQSSRRSRRGAGSIRR
jgi:hypothetical protein